jgi:hypothetical protein
VRIAVYACIIVVILAAGIAFKTYVFWPALDDPMRHGLTATNWWAFLFIVVGLGLIPWRVLSYIRRASDHRIPENIPKSKPAERGESDGIR